MNECMQQGCTAEAVGGSRYCEVHLHQEDHLIEQAATPDLGALMRSLVQQGLVQPRKAYGNN